MNWKTLAFLVVLVGALLYVTRLQEASEVDGPLFYQGPLLGDVRPDDVREIRWEHVERAEFVAMEKQDLAWMLVDPIEYPAAPDRVKLVLDGLFTNAVEVPPADIASLAPHFDPPRAIVTVIEQREGGLDRTYEVEIGQLDADGMQVEVRTKGRYLRILRNLDTVLLSSISDLRDRRIFRMSPANIVTIERSGFAESEAGLIDLKFLARREGPNWMLYEPQKVQLDPTAMGIWARVVSSIYIGSFLSDSPDPDVVRYGLSQPEGKLRLEDSFGNSQEIWFTASEGGGWATKRTDLPYIWSLPSQVASQLTDAWTDLRDTHLLRSFREDLGHVDLQVGDSVIRLSQGAAADSEWTVAQRRPGTTEFDASWPADKARIGEFLGDWEQGEIVSWMPNDTDPMSATVPPGEVARRVIFHLRHALEGETISALIGPTQTTSAGTPLRPYWRDGDGVVGQIPAPLGAWLDGGLAVWRSPLMWDLKESRLKQLKLTRGATTRQYLRKIQGTWRYSDVDAIPDTLLPVLDHLVYLRAEQHLEAANPAPLLDPIRVEFETIDATWKIAVVGLDASGRVLVDLGGHQAIAKNPELHAMLAALVPQ